MKLKFKKLASIILIFTFLFNIFSFDLIGNMMVKAEEKKDVEKHIKVRVEGLKNTLFDKDITLKDEINVKDLTLNALGNQNVGGADKGFITNILGEEKTDTLGWMYYLVDSNGDIHQSLLVTGEVSQEDNKIEDVIKDIKKYYEANPSYDYLTTIAFNHIIFEDKNKFDLKQDNNAASIANNIMGIIAIGKNPYNYEGNNYVQKLISSQKNNGKFVIGKNDENSATALAEAIISLDMASGKYNTEKAIGALIDLAKDGKYED